MTNLDFNTWIDKYKDDPNEGVFGRYILNNYEFITEHYVRQQIARNHTLAKFDFMVNKIITDAIKECYDPGINGFRAMTLVECFNISVWLNLNIIGNDSSWYDKAVELAKLFPEKLGDNNE